MARMVQGLESTMGKRSREVIKRRTTVSVLFIGVGHCNRKINGRTETSSTMSGTRKGQSKTKGKVHWIGKRMTGMQANGTN